MASPPHRDGLLTRARYTPLRDAFRLRLTGRLNLPRLVHNAGLPTPLADLVEYTARRTRLSRLERVDVAEELIAHFQDGLEAGRSAEALRDDFGDANQAARLIRRAKRRNHNIFQKLPRYSMYGLGVLALFYVIVAIRFFSGSPNPSHDYLADLNRVPAAVPHDQAAWPRYRSALVAMDDMPQWQGHETPMPGTESWPQVEKYIHEHAEQLSQIREAAAMAHLGFTATFHISGDDLDLWPAFDGGDSEVTDSSDRLLIGALLQHLTELRKMAMLLRYEAYSAAEQGEGELAVANIRAMVGIAEHAAEIGTIINQLVALSILGVANETTGELLKSNAEVFTDAQLTDMAHTLASALGGGTLQMDLGSERLWFSDLLQHMYTDDGRGGGRLTRRGLDTFATVMAIHEGPFGIDAPEFLQTLASPAAGLALAGRRAQAELYDRLLTRAEAESKAPLWQYRNTVEPEIRALASDPVQAIRYMPVTLMLPSVSGPYIQAEFTTMRRDGMLVTLALHLYQRRHGHWPDSLNQLVPTFLPAVPPDRFDGRPLRYALVDGLPVVYSIGANHQDNGGRPPSNVKHHEAMRWTKPEVAKDMRLNPGAHRHQQPDGDWILWPPQQDPRTEY